ncbi:Protein of unknown function [Pedobacter steynii]|uniref:DUF3347 domain-containing protein n=1 Tax=Pedobacter steynii TaxID=430522 RepID=A0A1G9N6W2_9SPHI|nr:DUF3347 domain-containing protein [Pedobacter steynii]NQX39400.1 DUF3347 domain-containing protein [Pedobacter steynii]SDL81857.1 Protein of unknown function [Pedobacter steynii]
MKLFIFSTLLATLFLAACSNSNPTTSPADATQNTDTTASVISSEKTKPAPADEIINGYLQLKNALAADDDKAAAEAGNVMTKAMASFDKSAISADQAKIYNDIEAGVKEHAEHIGENVGNLHHQREHFESLSQDIYDLAKAVGTGKKLYFDHCPMYNDNKGANWLSETKEIRNPYLGKSMLDCGSVKEELN